MSEQAEGAHMTLEDQAFLAELAQPIEYMKPNPDGQGFVHSHFDERATYLHALIETLADPDEPISENERRLLLAVVRAYGDGVTPEKQSVTPLQDKEEK